MNESNFYFPCRDNFWYNNASAIYSLKAFNVLLPRTRVMKLQIVPGKILVLSKAYKKKLPQKTYPHPADMTKSLINLLQEYTKLASGSSTLFIRDTY